VEQFGNPEQLFEFIADTDQAARLLRTNLGERTRTDLSYFLGGQWIYAQDRTPFRTNLGRLETRTNPNASDLRLTVNLITALTIKAQAATWPQGVYIDVNPPSSDLSPDQLLRAGAIERAVNSEIDRCGYLGARRTANTRRSIFGDYDFGFKVTMNDRELEVQGEQRVFTDKSFRTFTYEPTQLTLDPHFTSRNLCDHDHVRLTQTWTKSKIRRVLGRDIPDDQLVMVGKLEEEKLQFHKLTNGLMYHQYAVHARTPGARVHQLHIKDDTGAFTQLYLVLELADGKFEALNIDNPASPFASDTSIHRGLPLFLLRAHDRGDSPWSLSDVSMLRPEQDALNLDETFRGRMAQKSAGAQWIVDRKFFKGKIGSNEDLSGVFNNRVYGIIEGDSGTKQVPAAPPQLVKFPDPPQWLFQAREQHSSMMRDQIFRSDSNFGALKSHTSTDSFRRALEESDQVLGERVQEDVSEDRKALTFLAAQIVAAVKTQAPNMLKSLRDEGFGDEEFGAISGSDPTNLGCRIKVRDRTVRYRSEQAKRADLQSAAESQLVTSEQFRRQMASEMDSPITVDDDRMLTNSRKAAMQLLAGIPWEPVVLGNYGEWFVSEFQAALFDRRARHPEIKRIINEAITGQIQMNVQEMVMRDPAVFLEEMRAAQAAEQQQGEAMPEAITAGDALRLVAGSAQQGAGQPAVA